MINTIHKIKCTNILKQLKALNLLTEPDMSEIKKESIERHSDYKPYLLDMQKTNKDSANYPEYAPVWIKENELIYYNSVTEWYDPAYLISKKIPDKKILYTVIEETNRSMSILENGKDTPVEYTPDKMLDSEFETNVSPEFTASVETMEKYSKIQLNVEMKEEREDDGTA